MATTIALTRQESRSLPTTDSERTMPQFNRVTIERPTLPAWIAAAALAYAVATAFDDVMATFIYWSDDLSAELWTLAVTTAYLPLHVRHVWFGVRGLPPPRGAWTLALMAGLILAAFPLAGDYWTRSLGSLAASCLIVLRPRWSIPAFAVVAMGAFPLSVAYGPDDFGTAMWNALVVHWRGLILFALVWLAAALRRMHAAREALAGEAVVRERRRIDAELRQTLGAALESILTRGSRVEMVINVDRSAARSELMALVEEARTTLAGARQVVREYRQPSLLAELETAAVLLPAAGVPTTVVPPGALTVEAVRRARRELRGAMAELLGGPPGRACRIQVTPAGQVLVGVQPGPVSDGSHT